MPTSPSSSQTKTEIIAYWNGVAAERWVQYQNLLDRALAPLGRAAMDAAAVRPGEHVLDVGCGAGGTSVALADRVGPTGTVLGVDVSEPLLARARERGQGIANLRFELGDASSHHLPQNQFDLIYSRFGVMFFTQPEQAFEHLLQTLKPEGRLAFVCWRGLAENPWAKVPLDAVLPLLGPQEPSDPEAPGPFAFASAERIRKILVRAGFNRVQVEPLETELYYGDSLETGVDFLLHIGPAARALADASETLRQQALQQLREAATPYLTPAGLRFRCGAWVISSSR